MLLKKQCYCYVQSVLTCISLFLNIFTQSLNVQCLSFIIECDPKCSNCDKNGAGKCDNPHCLPGYGLYSKYVCGGM